MHYLEFEMHVLHFKIGYFAGEKHYLHSEKRPPEMLRKVKYVKVAPAAKPARRRPFAART